jgi:apolipoprotein N-acyltransferase
VCFNAAFTLSEPVFPKLLIAVYVICLVQLALLPSTRHAFYLSLLVGLLCFAPQLVFFGEVFGAPAFLLWLLLAFWIALFVALTQVTLARCGPGLTALLTPFLWTGLEYFRSELYYLRFSWLTPGYALSGGDAWLTYHLGVYGIGFLMAAVAGVSLLSHRKFAIALLLFIATEIANLFIPRSPAEPRSPALRAAGVQLEFPTIDEVLAALDQLTTSHPDADLLVLSEYTLDGPVPDSLKSWCKKNARHLLVGGKDPADGTRYFDTAFVVGPTGEVVFRQGKSVPIQFFDDGLPARQQAVWNSPWGRIGICVCYDLSYARVTDELIRQGAQVLVVPAMDVTGWGLQEHRSNARVVPVRAAEYGVPVFRLASSGISQAVDGRGRIVAQAAFPGRGETIVATLALPEHGTLPLDRWLAPFCVGVTGLWLLSHLTWRWTVGRLPRFRSR